MIAFIATVVFVLKLFLSLGSCWHQHAVESRLIDVLSSPPRRCQTVVVLSPQEKSRVRAMTHVLHDEIWSLGTSIFTVDGFLLSEGYLDVGSPDDFCLNIVSFISNSTIVPGLLRSIASHVLGRFLNVVVLVKEAPEVEAAILPSATIGRYFTVSHDGAIQR